MVDFPQKKNGSNDVMSNVTEINLLKKKIYYFNSPANEIIKI